MCIILLNVLLPVTSVSTVIIQVIRYFSPFSCVLQKETSEGVCVCVCVSVQMSVCVNFSVEVQDYSGSEPWFSCHPDVIASQSFIYFQLSKLMLQLIPVHLKIKHTCGNPILMLFLTIFQTIILLRHYYYIQMYSVLYSFDNV